MTGIAPVTLDERLRTSPIREGFIARTHFLDACASLWLEGELVHLEDLVLHDAEKDVRSPTHALTRAHAVLRARRRIASADPGWALSASGLGGLRGRAGEDEDADPAKPLAMKGGARLFRQHLVEIGVCRSAPAALQPAEPCIVADFKVWLRKHRGASDSTIKLYARDAAHLMLALGDDPVRWEPAAIRSFFLDRASHCGKGTVEKLTTSLRAFLRYLAVKGRCRAGLADVIPGYAHWRLADLPRYLAAAQVNRLIAACDGEVVERRRDRAILLLLARLGLRAGDVAQLRLEDIEWGTGSLRVSGKSRRRGGR